MNIRLPALIAAVIVLAAGGHARAAVEPADVRHELERIENLRLLHRYSIQDIHDSKALAIYLKGWGGPDRSGEAESLMQEAADLYGTLRGIDNGGKAIQASIDGLGAENVPQEQLDLLQRARRFVAVQVNDFHRRSAGLKAELTDEVKQTAAGKAQWNVVSKPEPWADPARDADRRAGLQRGASLSDRWFFSLPDDEQEYALAKAAKAGIQYANMPQAASDWAGQEPRPGEYDFSRLDAAIEKLARHNIRACPMLASLTGKPPQWLIDQHGDLARFTVTVKNRQGETSKEVRGINIFHAPTAAAYGKFLEAYAAHLRQRWPQQVEAVFVEGGQPEIEAPADESAVMDAYWRSWSNTDTPWRTPEAILADENPDPAAVVRAERCREQWLLDYVARIRAALKKGWPELRVQTMTVNDDFHRLQARVTGKSRDLAKLAQLTDNPGTGTTACGTFQLVRSLARDNWLWAYAMHSGCGATPSADLARHPFLNVSHSTAGNFVGSTSRYNYPQSWYRYPDRQLGDFGIGSYIATPRRAQELAPVALNTSMPPAGVAILWSQNTVRCDRSFNLYESALAWGHLLRRTFINYDYVAEDGLDGSLDGYKVLILPNTQYMATQTCDVIREWTRRGGSLLAFGAPGLFDEHGKRRESLPLADVLGADIAAMRTPDRVDPYLLETTHSEGSFTFRNPRPWKAQTDLTAALKLNGATARGWFVGTANDVAIADNTFGRGKAAFCGFPVGHQYWQAARYELTYGLTHSRHSNYNLEQKRYEAWALDELLRLAVEREVTLTRGNFLRAQRNDDPDWYHVYRNGPEYSEYMWEEERPVRTVEAFYRRRDGIDNAYVGLAHTEGNYFWQRAYFRCMLSGAVVDASVAAPGVAPVVFDARLGVPVPSSVKDGRADFTTWVPMAQSAAFAVAPAGNVRLFGEGKPSGIGPAQLLPQTAEYETGDQLQPVEILEHDQVASFIDGLKDTSVVIGCGDSRFKPVANELAQWLKRNYNIESRITVEGSRASCRYDYMDSFGWPGYGGPPVHAHILIGNCQDNGLMWQFLTLHGSVCWLPLEVNQNFPGIGRSVVMMSSPVISDANGRIRTTNAARQLVIGAGFPSEAMQAVKALEQAAK